jgi:hypothetical protein
MLAARSGFNGYDSQAAVVGVPLIFTIQCRLEMLHHFSQSLLAIAGAQRLEAEPAELQQPIRQSLLTL